MTETEIALVRPQSAAIEGYWEELPEFRQWVKRSNDTKAMTMTRFYEPDLTVEVDSPFIRDAANKLVRRSYWMDMDDRTLVMVMVKGIGSHLTNDEKRAHLADLRREHLVDQVCIQEILPPKR